jgi:hypothetical protein
VTVFGISSVEPLASAARELVKLVRKISTDIGNGRWMELAHDCVQWWTLLIVISSLMSISPKVSKLLTWILHTVELGNNGDLKERLWGWEVDELVCVVSSCILGINYVDLLISVSQHSWLL